MRNINRHKSSDKQSIMTESSFALTILLIVGITVTVGTMVLTVFFNLSLPIKIAVSAILIPDRHYTPLEAKVLDMALRFSVML